MGFNIIIIHHVGIVMRLGITNRHNFFLILFFNPIIGISENDNSIETKDDEEWISYFSFYLEV